MSLGIARRAAVGCALVAGLVPLGAGAAQACHGGNHHHANNGVAAVSYTLRHTTAKHGVLAVASSYLGVTAGTIESQLAQGKTLGQIADATAGHSAAGLVDAYVAALKTKLDHFVAVGKLSPTQESDLLAKATPWIQKLVATSWTHHHAWRAFAVFHGGHHH
jgi:hypothetical protein